MRTTAILLTLTLALHCTVAHADLTIEYQFRYKLVMRSNPAGNQNRRGVETTWVKKDKLAVKNHEGNVTIYRFDKALILTLNTKNKTYTEQTFEEHSAQRNRGREAMKKMLENPNIPEASKKAIRAQYEMKYTAKKGDTATVAGQEATQFTISRNGKRMYDISLCTTLENAATFEKMSTVLEAYGDQTKELMKQLKGVTVRFKMLNVTPYMTMSVRRTASKISTAAVADKHFEIPKGYTKQSS